MRAISLCVGFSQHMVVVDRIPHQRCWVDRETGLLQCRSTHSVWAGGAVYQVIIMWLPNDYKCMVVLLLQVEWRRSCAMVSQYTGGSLHSECTVHCTHRQWLYGSVWVGLYILHVAYLSLGRFHYGYNMVACVIAGMTVSSLVPRPLPPGKERACYCKAINVGVHYS